MFNLIGYKLYTTLLVENANQLLENSIDENNYYEKDLITIKTPIKLPYYTNSNTFTRAYGEIEVKNILYRYVKTRIFNDSLEMLCIPNNSKQQLLSCKDKFAQVIFDLQNDSSKKSSKKIVSFVKLINDYEKCVGYNIQIIFSKFSKNINCEYTSRLYTSFLTIQEQPPDAAMSLA